MSKKPVLLIDVDGVLADFVGSVLADTRDLKFTFDRTQVRNFYDVFDLLPVHIRNQCYDRISTVGWCEKIEPYEGAKAFMQRINSSSREVYACTTPWATSEHWLQERRKWLYQHVGLQATRIISCHDKTLVRGDVLVEDKAENVIAWAGVNPDSLGILIDQPWNASFTELPSNVVRVFGLNGVVDAIEARYSH